MRPDGEVAVHTCMGCLHAYLPACVPQACLLYIGIGLAAVTDTVLAKRWGDIGVLLLFQLGQNLVLLPGLLRKPALALPVLLCSHLIISTCSLAIATGYLPMVDSLRGPHEARRELTVELMTNLPFQVHQSVNHALHTAQRVGMGHSLAFEVSLAS